MFRSFLVAAMAIAGLAPALAQADPIDAGGAVIVVAGDQVIEGGTHVWNAPVIVAPGSSLTIKNATVYVDWRPPTITRVGQSDVDLCFHGTASFCPSPIQVVEGTLRVHDSTIDTNVWDEMDGYSGWSILGTGATFDLQRNTFLHQETIATQLPGPARSVVKDNVIRWATMGVKFIRGSEADIVGNVIEHAQYGISLIDTSGLVSGNQLRNIVRGWATFGLAIDVQNSIVGEKMFTTTPVVEDNVIEDSVQALRSLTGFPNVFRDNVVRNNLIGATIGMVIGDEIVHQDASIWTGNVFDGNKTHARVYASGSVSEPRHIEFEFHGNSLVNTGCTDIQATQMPARVTITVDADDNWWGTPAGPASDHGPDCPAFRGDVSVSRWLTAAP